MCESPPTLQKSQNFLDYGLFGSQYDSQDVRNYRFCDLCSSSYWDLGHVSDLFHRQHKHRGCECLRAPVVAVASNVEHDVGRKEIASKNAKKRGRGLVENELAGTLARAKKRKRGIKPYAKSIIRNWLSHFTTIEDENWNALVRKYEQQEERVCCPRELLRDFLALEEHFLNLEPKKKQFPHYETTLAKLLELQGKPEPTEHLEVVHHPKSQKKFDMIWWEFCKKQKWPYIQKNQSVLQYIKKKKF